MSQNAQFEEEFRDGPSPAPTYQAGYTSPQPASYSLNVPGQKLLVNSKTPAATGNVGARLALAIVSLIFVLIMFLATAAVAAMSYEGGYSGLVVLMVFLSLALAVVALLINLIFNYKR